MREGPQIEGGSVHLIPKYLFSSIYDIDISRLRARGILLLLADLDNTLAPYGVQTPDDRVLAWRDSLNEAGITLFILSNSRKPGRAQRFAEALGVPYEGHAGKPKSGGFRRAMDRMGVTPSQTAIVGDQIFTDIWGGNNAGVLTLMVKPIQFGNVFRALRYAGETPFRVRAQGGETL